MSETKRDYEVARGKPPVRNRFKKGQSGSRRVSPGNPRGPRRKASRRCWSTSSTTVMKLAIASLCQPLEVYFNRAGHGVS